MDHFLGIDGGGTRTVGWVGDSEGRVLVRAERGPSNPLKVGFPAAERELLKVYRACLQEAGVTFPMRRRWLASVCAGIAGVDRASVHRPLFSWMRRHLPARRHLLTSDAAIALAAAVRAGHGIVVIAGTGSIAFARDGRGKVLRAGGWGIPFDDLGSGYDLGRNAVTAALAAFDGRGHSTVLMDMINRHFKLKNITEIVSQQPGPAQIAALLPVVLQAASQGDLVAHRLCEKAARELADLPMALLQRVGWMNTAVPVVTTGGVFQASPLIRRTFARHLRHAAPAARVQMLQDPPVSGALWLARQAAQATPVPRRLPSSS